MDAYIYNADLYCDTCGSRLIDECEAEGFEDDGDSDGFPQLVRDGGGESDTPQHCGECGLFLESPLTDDGRKYVIESYNAYRTDENMEWMAFYDLHRECEWCGDSIDGQPDDTTLCPGCLTEE